MESCNTVIVINADFWSTRISCFQKKDWLLYFVNATISRFKTCNSELSPKSVHSAMSKTMHALLSPSTFSTRVVLTFYAPFLRETRRYLCQRYLMHYFAATGSAKFVSSLENSDPANTDVDDTRLCFRSHDHRPLLRAVGFFNAIMLHLKSCNITSEN